MQTILDYANQLSAGGPGSGRRPGVRQDLGYTPRYHGVRVKWALSRRQDEAVHRAGFSIATVHMSLIHPTEYNSWNDAHKDMSTPSETAKVESIKNDMVGGKRFFPGLATKEKDGTYSLEDGHHRYVAARQAGEKYMAVVVGPDTSKARLDLGDALDKATREDEAGRSLPK